VSFCFTNIFTNLFINQSINDSTVTREVSELEDALDRKMSSADVKIGFYRDRSTAVEKRKEMLTEQLHELQEERGEAGGELQSVQSELDALSVNGQKPKTDREMKEYMKELGDKTAKYKSRKAELQSIRDEVNVLMRTAEVLKSRDDNIKLVVQRHVTPFRVAPYT
jgi:chromosome segregation ATPase